MGIREDVVRKAAQERRVLLRKASNDSVLEEMVKGAAAADHYDVFLSHAYADRELVVGLTSIFESQGMSVYVDWIEDPQANRKRVTAENADMLRQRMGVSDALVVAYSANAAVSPWVTWEIAYFDGLKKRVAVLAVDPVGAAAVATGYTGQEYMQLYPSIDLANSKTGVPTLWVNRKDRKYNAVKSWSKDGTFPSSP